MATTTDVDAPVPHDTFRPAPRRPGGPSGTVLFLVTLGVALLLVLISVVSLRALDGDSPETAFLVPAVCLVVWVVYFVVLLFLAGRAISDHRRPGEAGTSIVLALFLTPAIFAALPVAVAAQGALGLAGLLGGEPSGAPLEDGFTGMEDVEGESSVDGYGSDAQLDQLYDDCEIGQGTACNELWQQSPMGSEYERFALDNGGGPTDG